MPIDSNLPICYFFREDSTEMNFTSFYLLPLLDYFNRGWLSGTFTEVEACRPRLALEWVTTREERAL